MGYEWLRKKIKEKIESGTLGMGYEAPVVPGVDHNYQPASQGAYHAPESAAPTQKPTTPISTAKTAVPAVSTSNDSTTKVDPKTGAAGLKAFTDIVATESRFGEAGIGNTGLIDAYNAGLNGVDLSRKTKDDAAAGLYIGQVWAMYDAGKQDAKAAAERENEEAMSKSVETAQHETVDNWENIGYPNNATSRNDSNNNATADEYVPDMGAGVQYINNDTGSSGSSTKGSTNATSSGDLTSSNETEPYIISDLEKELNYMMDMMFLNGAESSAIPSIREAYEWLKNAKEKINEKDINKKLEKMKETFYAFMGGIGNDQIARSNQIAVGKNDKVGLADEIYAYKSKYKSKTNTNPKPVVPMNTGDSEKTTGIPKQLDNQKSYSWGQVGRNALGETLRQNPDLFGNHSGLLHEAYQAGLNGVDFTKELKKSASAGNFFEEIIKLYNAGKTDAKIAAVDQVSKMGNDSGAQEEEQYRSSNNKSGKTSTSKTNANETSPWANDFNYLRNMFIYCGAGKSKNLNVQKAYQYFMNSDNIGKRVPQEFLDTFKSFTDSIDDERKIKIVMKMFSNKDYDYSFENIVARNDFVGYPTSGGRMTQAYHGEYKNGKWQNGGGIDIGGLHVGTPVYAVADGTVEYKAYVTSIGGKNYYCSYGVFAKLTIPESDGKDYYLYAHLDPKTMFENGLISNFELEKMMDEIIMSSYNKKYSKRATYNLGNFSIKKGQIIGYLGNSGNSKAKHLHFGCFINGKCVNIFGEIFPIYRN